MSSVFPFKLLIIIAACANYHSISASLSSVSSGSLNHRAGNVGVGNSNANGGGNGGVGVGGMVDWHRNLESQISRVVVRLDQLELRVNRVQSMVQMRFDNIENGLTSTKLRMDLWGDELNRIEEQLSRKWKILESKFDVMLSSVDAKLDSKLTAIQRDNRRHHEFLTSNMNNHAVTQAKHHDKVFSTIRKVNSSVDTLMRVVSNDSLQTSVLLHTSDKILTVVQELATNVSRSSSQPGLWPVAATSAPRRSSPSLPASSRHVAGNSSSSSTSSSSSNSESVQYHLIGNKVTNMFEDLMRRTSTMETTLKDIFILANMTRRDVYDGFHALLSPSSHGQGGGGRASSGTRAASSDVMSRAILEMLASVDTLSNTLGRKLTDFSQSVDERLEMVSMSINGFLESCIRVQDYQPMLEEQIAELLLRILDTVENSTKSGSDLWLTVADRIQEDRENMTRISNEIRELCTSPPDREDFYEDPIVRRGENEEFALPTTEVSTGTGTEGTFEVDTDRPSEFLFGGRSRHRTRTGVPLDLTEEDKHSMWQSLKEITPSSST